MLQEIIDLRASALSTCAELANTRGRLSAKLKPPARSVDLDHLLHGTPPAGSKSPCCRRPISSPGCRAQQNSCDREASNGVLKRIRTVAVAHAQTWASLRRHARECAQRGAEKQLESQLFLRELSRRQRRRDSWAGRAGQQRQACVRELAVSALVTGIPHAPILPAVSSNPGRPAALTDTPVRKRRCTSSRHRYADIFGGMSNGGTTSPPISDERRYISLTFSAARRPRAHQRAAQGEIPHRSERPVHFEELRHSRAGITPVTTSGPRPPVTIRIGRAKIRRSGATPAGLQHVIQRA